MICSKQFIEITLTDFSLVYFIVKEEPPSGMQNDGSDGVFGGPGGLPGPLDIKPEDIKPFDDGPSGGNDFTNGKIRI